jgi:hypothetical protein
VYPAVILVYKYFISAAVIFLASPALIVQFSLPYNPKHTGPEVNGSNPTTGITLLWARNPFRGNFNQWQVSRKVQGTAMKPQAPQKQEIIDKLRNNWLLKKYVD